MNAKYMVLGAMLLAACSKPADSAPPPGTAPATTPPPAPTAVTLTDGKPSHVDGANFGLDIASAACKAGATCALTLKLAVQGEYHVNKEYPYKFVAKPSPGVELLGKPEASTFTRESGDFTQDGEKAATMTVRFKPDAAGPKHVTGVYKLSVCSPEHCQIEQAQLDVQVPVL